MQIRAERAGDIGDIRQVNLSAFETATEADLVDALREQARPIVSLVAEDDGAIVGHILFSPVTLSSDPDLRIIGLAPMAVVPDRQRRGVGSALARAGVAACREEGYDAVMCSATPSTTRDSASSPRLASGFAPSTTFRTTSSWRWS